MAIFQGTVLAGSTISAPTGDAGVAGLRVLDFGDRDYVLTCAHVVAPPGHEREGTQIDTPARKQGLGGSSVFGTVHTWSRLRTGFTHEVDAALIKPFLGVRISNESLRLPAPPCRVMPDLRSFLDAPDAPRDVQICTGHGPVRGTIVGFTSRPFPLGRDEFHFKNILEYTAEVFPGDSGSIVVEPRSRLVMGLHFAGVAPRQGYCIPIDTVLDFFPEHKLRIAQ